MKVTTGYVIRLNEAEIKEAVEQWTRAHHKLDGYTLASYYVGSLNAEMVFSAPEPPAASDKTAREILAADHQMTEMADEERFREDEKAEARRFGDD